MKKHIYFTGIWIAAVLLAVIVACNPHEEKTVEPKEMPIPELAAIDSLMWRQPDSAFLRMRQFMVSPEADSLNVFERHYCQLLISELLYKNYKPQTNRDELLRAVDYFDSVVENGYKTDGGKADKCGMSPQRDASLRERDVFLNARAHYINGTGYYEQGNVVNACAEYLKALEVMEEKLDKKTPKGKDAVFMFYTYNRLLSLFSTQFMMDPAIFCCEQALACCQNEPSLSKEIPNTYYHMGKQYDKKGEKDIARYYYGMAIEGLSDINNPVYRDAMSTKALCDYQVGLGVDSSLTTIRQMLSHANSEKEKLTRFLTIGVIFTIEQSIDSALYYLEPIYESKDNISLQTQAAEYLLVNYDNTENKEKAEECMRFLSDHKKSEGETKAFVSKLEAMYKDYMNQKQEKEAEEAREKAVRKAMSIIIPVAIGAVLVIIVLAKLRNKKLLKEQREEADRALGEAEQEHDKELRLWQAEADKVLEETKKNYEEELEQLKTETEQQLEEVERKHQQWMAEAKERHEEELRVQKDLADKEMEKTKKRHEEELEAERLAYQAEMAEKEANAQTERKLHEETLKRHQVEIEQRMSEAERKHQQKLEEIAGKHELEMQAQQDKTKKEAEQTRKRHESELEAERMAYQKEREALRQSLQQREEQVKAMETAIVQQREEAERRREAFLKEPICQCILSQVRKKPITTRENAFELGLALKDEDFEQLGAAVEKHYTGFDHVLLSHCPSLKQGLISLCHLHLLGINDREIAMLKNVSYSAIKKQNESLRERLGVENDVAAYILRMAEGLCVPQDVPQGVSHEITQVILDLVSNNPKITREEIAHQLGVSSKTVGRYLKKLEGRVRYVGSGYSGHWEVVE